jgi:hypothetical protein
MAIPISLAEKCDKASAQTSQTGKLSTYDVYTAQSKTTRDLFLNLTAEKVDNFEAVDTEWREWIWRLEISGLMPQQKTCSLLH